MFETLDAKRKKFATLLVIAVSVLGGVGPVLLAESAWAADCTPVANLPYKSGSNVKATVGASGSCSGIKASVSLHRYLSVLPDTTLSSGSITGGGTTTLSAVGTSSHIYYSKSVLSNGAIKQSARYTFS